MRTHLSITCFLILMSLIPVIHACHGQHSDTTGFPNAANDSDSQITEPGYPATGLPAPSQLKSCRNVTSGIFEYGDEFIISVTHPGAFRSNRNCCRFTPDWSVAASGDHPAFAVYEFDTSVCEHNNTLSLSWAAQYDHSDLWVGLADFANDTWVWRDVGASNTMAFDGGVFDSGSQVLAVVLLTGHDPWELEFIWLGETLPTLIQGVSPVTGHTGDFLDITPEQHPLSGPASLWQWDFGGGAIPATSNQQSPSITLGAEGVYECSVIASTASTYTSYDFLLTVTEAGTTWQIESIAGSVNGGGQTALALEPPLDYPHILHVSEGDLYHVNNNGYGWESRMLASHLGGDRRISDSSLAISPTGEVYAAHACSSFMLVAIHNGLYWSNTALDEADDPVFQEYFLAPSIDIGPAGQPHVSYQLDTYGDDYNRDYVLYVSYDGSNWSTPSEVAATGGVMGFAGIRDSNPIAVNSLGQPWVSWFSGTPPEGLFAASYNGAWNELELTGVSSATDIGLAVAWADDKPRIAYATPFKDLVFALHNGTDWVSWTVPFTGNVDGDISLALDSLNRPHISYYDDNDLDLRYAYSLGLSWDVVIVDEMGDVGQYNSIALDSNDRVHISYYDASQDCVKLAVAPAG